MIYLSASPPSGGDSDGSSDLQDLSPDELVARVEELEDQLRSARKRHQAEMRRGMEAVERLKDGGSPKGSTTYFPTHNHEDGYDVITDQRVAILIDVQNMYYAARNLYNSKLEFSKLLRYIGRGRRLSRAIAYIVERPGMEQDKFVEVLRRNGYEVRKKLLIERSDGSQKGDWDLGIALDAIALADKIDVVVLVTGDGDFVTLVHFLHSKGIRVEVASFPETTALELMRSCNHYHRLNENVLLPGGQFQGNERDRDRDRDLDRGESEQFDRDRSRERPAEKDDDEDLDLSRHRSPIDDYDEEDDDFRL